MPVLDPNRDSEITSLQFIRGDGTKLFLKDGVIKGNSFWIKGDKTICICEGWATGASIFEATGHTVLIAFNAGNLEAVAEKMMEKSPNRPFILCADNDAYNAKSKD